MARKESDPAPMVEATIIKQPCFFCGQDETVSVNEHYILCPQCHAYYTYMLIKERWCDDIPGRLPDNCPVVFRQPKFDCAQKIFIIEDEKTGKQWCSECGEYVVADGW